MHRMPKKAIIAQVSDMHINAVAETYRNINVRKNFIDVLQFLKERQIDLLVLSGDLAAADGEIEAYQWIKETLTRFPYPYVVMAGNHDRVAVMKQIFDIPVKDVQDDMLYFSRRVNGHRLLFLDTSTYILPKKQLAWLYQQLHHSDESILLFMHHPPLLCDCLFMDSFYPLGNIAETWELLQQLKVVKHIFCGHYHTDKILKEEGKIIYLTPSTMLQIDTKSNRFVVEHIRPGWRMIEWDGEQVNTQVEYLP